MTMQSAETESDPSCVSVRGPGERDHVADAPRETDRRMEVIWAAGGVFPAAMTIGSLTLDAPWLSVTLRLAVKLPLCV